METTTAKTREEILESISNYRITDIMNAKPIDLPPIHGFKRKMDVKSEIKIPIDQVLSAMKQAQEQAVDEALKMAAEIALPSCDRYEDYAVKYMNERKEKILSLRSEVLSKLK